MGAGLDNRQEVAERVGEETELGSIAMRKYKTLVHRTPPA